MIRKVLLIRNIMLLGAFLIRSSGSLTTRSQPTNHNHERTNSGSHRREYLVAAASVLVPPCCWLGPAAAADSSSSPLFSTTLQQIIEVRAQLLDNIPSRIEAEKWDAVRSILLQPPLADCWAKTNRPLLTNYATSLGELGGDELAALEAKEQVISHLRYLDMAAYNNVFNPIKSMGENGATAGLIRSYYEDPINEFKASVAAFDELIQLGQGLK
jgi:hypothetical protein